MTRIAVAARNSHLVNAARQALIGAGVQIRSPRE